MTPFTDIFVGHPTDAAHMVGGMTVLDDELYVGVGDAEFPMLAQHLEFPMGKVLRMSLDGNPLADNPFYEDESRTKIKNYIYAYGLRNPFGVLDVNGALFVTDNGPAADRFVRIERGANYFYDGSDWSIGSHADVLFAPAVSPVQMAFIAAGAEAWPVEYQSKFFVALSGNIWHEGPGTAGQKALAMIDYDFDTQRIVDRPRPVLRWAGSGKQMPVGVAVGPDGLYVVNMYGDLQDEKASVLRLSYDPTREHPRSLSTSATNLINSKGCLSCHSKKRGAIAEPLYDTEGLMARINERLDSPEYERLSLELDARTDEPFASTRDARRAVRESSGEERVRVWMLNRLLQPKFDMPNAQMPTFGLTMDEASSIVEELIRGRPTRRRGFFTRMHFLAKELVPNPTKRYAVAFAFGALVMFVLLKLGQLVGRLRSAA